MQARADQSRVHEQLGVGPHAVAGVFGLDPDRLVVEVDIAGVGGWAGVVGEAGGDHVDTAGAAQAVLSQRPWEVSPAAAHHIRDG
jgi:hypothetical protein